MVPWQGNVAQTIKELKIRRSPDGTVVFPPSVTEPPANAKFNDVWFKKNGNSTELWIFEKQDDGDHIRKIINASSIAGHITFDMLGAYSATKFAVRGLTQAAAKELGRYKITVNAYCPGIVGTSMWDLIDQRMVEELGGQRGQYLEQYSKLITMGRVETPQDVANYVSYLASPKADYMTGQAVQIDGGIQFI